VIINGYHAFLQRLRTTVLKSKDKIEGKQRNYGVLSFRSQESGHAGHLWLLVFQESWRILGKATLSLKNRTRT
jgi:hypothetical protein